MRVGTSNRCDHLFPTLWDHPHACGDKFYSVKNCTLCSGSSPCVWGQVQNVLQALRLLWIIPMRVGTSSWENAYAGRYKDHPHACGDK